MQGSDNTPGQGHAMPVRLIFSSVSAVLLAAVGTFVPLLGFWGLLLCPLPLAVLGCRDGMRPMAWGLFLTEALLALLLSPAFALYFLLGCAPLSLALCLVPRTKWTGGEALLVCALVSLGAKLALAGAFWALTGQNILLPDMKQMDLALTQFYSNLPPEQSQTIMEGMRRMLSFLPYMLPSLVLICAELDSLVNYMACGAILRRRGVERRPPALPPFADWRFPRSLLPAYLLSVLLSYLWDADTWVEGAMFAVNLKLALNVLFFAQGLALFSWWMDRRGFRPVSRFLLLFFMLFPLMWPWLVFLGIADIAFDLRARAGRRDAR